MKTHPLQTGKTKCDNCAHHITVPPTKQNPRGVSQCGIGNWEDPYFIPTDEVADYNPIWDNCNDFENDTQSDYRDYYRSSRENAPT